MSGKAGETTVEGSTDPSILTMIQKLSGILNALGVTTTTTNNPIYGVGPVVDGSSHSESYWSNTESAVLQTVDLEVNVINLCGIGYAEHIGIDDIYPNPARVLVVAALGHTRS